MLVSVISLLVQRPAVKPSSQMGTAAVVSRGGVGAFDGRVLCARAPGLTLVRDPGWFRVGDMMVDGVNPAGVSVAAARSF